MDMPTAYLAYDYARFYDWSCQGMEDLPCYVTLARRYGPRLLELACGTGRLTLPLARDGFTITGLDLSPEMLRIAREKLQREPPEVQARVRLVQGDMSDFALGEPADLALLPVSSIFHLHTRAQQVGCLACMRRHLAPGGAAVIDVTPAEMMANQAVGEEREYRSGVNPETGKLTRELGRKLSLDKRTQRVTVEHTYVEEDPEGETRRSVFVDNYTWVREEEMRELLAEAGLPKVAVFGSYDFQFFEKDSRRMIFVAQH
jgi:ubiquinone/menaquinone biosynthesis C-methylase UbiE